MRVLSLCLNQWHLRQEVQINCIRAVTENNNIGRNMKADQGVHVVLHYCQLYNES